MFFFFFFTRNIFKKRRSAATHVLVFMASCVKRTRKPYAIPLRFIPIGSIRDQQIRDFARPIKVDLVNAGVIPIGNVVKIKL